MSIFSIKIGACGADRREKFEKMWNFCKFSEFVWFLQIYTIFAMIFSFSHAVQYAIFCTDATILQWLQRLHDFCKFSQFVWRYYYISTHNFLTLITKGEALIPLAHVWTKPIACVMFYVIWVIYITRFY